MPKIQCEIVREKTTTGDQMMSLYLKAEHDLPQQLKALFVPANAMPGMHQEFEICRSPANNQIVVIGPRNKGLLTLRGHNAEGHASEGSIEVNDEHYVPAAAQGVAPPVGPAEGPERDGGRGGGGGRRGNDNGRDKVEVSGSISLNRAADVATRGRFLRDAVKRSSEAMSFSRFNRFVELAFCDDPVDGTREGGVKNSLLDALAEREGSSSTYRVDSFERLKLVAEIFVLANSVALPSKYDASLSLADPARQISDMTAYLDGDTVLPYLRIIYDRLGLRAPRSLQERPHDEVARCRDILERRSQQPCFIELIWSYWHEEAMQAQTMAAISQRFQNRRAPNDRDPLLQLEIDPLRPLNHLLWKYAQGEDDRLSVLRRAHEYEHEYGFPLQGKAVSPLRPADRRSKFLEAFHNLLYRCVQFYKEDDDTTHVADGFSVLNALKETHYVLSHGAHNQFGDLPATARQEMLIEQWILSRPEMREFLGSRPMVAYPEAWMDKVDTVKTLKGWNDVSVVHFHDLAVFGEILLLTIRWDRWSEISDPDEGKQWARELRPQVQGYIHALRATLGVDLAAEITSSREEGDRYLPPSVHLLRRLKAQTAAR
jgi:hypothetical protein